MEKFNRNQIELLEELSDKYNVFVIIDNSGIFNIEVYISNSYRTATETNPYLSIGNYRKITNIIEQNSVYINNTNILNTILTAIDNLNVVNKEKLFSTHFQWIKF